MGTRCWRVERRESPIFLHYVCWPRGPHSGLLYFGLVFPSGLASRVFDMKTDFRQQQSSGKHGPVGVAAPSYLFRIDRDGSVHVVDEGIQFSNGLAFSRDCSTLYFSDSVARCIYAYNWNRETGNLANRRVFVRLPREHGFPDGLTVDAEGFIWCAHWFGARVTRYDPDGKVERVVALPATQTSSLAFEGPDLDVIFVTSASKSNMLTEAPAGYNPERVFVG